jgi:hypothetical protein
MLKMLDFFQDMFDIFSGLRFVHYYDGNTHTADVNEIGVRIFDANGVISANPTTVSKGSIIDYQQTYLRDIFFNYGPVQKAFTAITAIAIILAIAASIYAVFKSVHDMTMDGSNPLGQVGGRIIKTAVTFALVPIMCFSILQISTVVMIQTEDIITTSYDGEKAPSIGTIIFLCTSMGAEKTKVTTQSLTDAVRNPFYTYNVQNPKSGTKNWRNYDDVQDSFSIAKFNYVVGAILVILTAYVLISALFIFVKTMFQMVLLYLVSPFFVMTIPIDDGAHFKKWRDAFIGQMIAGFGTVFTMKLFFLFAPILVSNKIQLASNVDMDYILKSLLIIGGLFAAKESQHLIVSIINPDAASGNQKAGGVFGSAFTSVKGLMRSVSGGV